MKKQSTFHAILVLAGVVLISYYFGLRVGFVEDDWSFLNSAVTLSPADYLRQSFDPQVQFIFYRPMHEMLWWLEYLLFGSDPVGYHFVWVLLHLGNCLLLFALTRRATRNFRLAFVAALVYSCVPLFNEAVLWPADAQPEATLFLLSACWLWWNYLEARTARNYCLALILSFVGILTKETNVILPIILFLIELLLVRGNLVIKELVKRYCLFGLFLLLYLGLSYRNLTYGVFPSQLGYGIGDHLRENLLAYIGYIGFPWADISPWSFLIVIVLLALGLWVAKREDGRVLFLLIGAVVIISPVLPRPGANPRYIYTAGMMTPIALGLLFERASKIISRSLFVGVAPVSIALIVVGSGLGLYQASLDREDYVLLRRLPFRNIAQQHSKFPDDTYLYFINYSANYLATMFRVRYGPQVSVSDIYTPREAELGSHKNSIVIYFDKGAPQELPVKRESLAQKRFSPAVEFDQGIILKGYDLVSARMPRGGKLELILYWQAKTKIKKDYTVFLHLIDAQGQMIDGVDSQPRDGAAPTSTWQPNILVPDGIVMPIGAETLPSNNLSLELGLYEFPDLRRLSIIDANGLPAADKIIIGPLQVTD